MRKGVEKTGEEKEGDRGKERKRVLVPGTARNVLLQPLLSDSQYKITVSPVYPDGEDSTLSLSTMGRTLSLSAPTNLRVSEEWYNRFRLTWDVPASPTLGYRIIYQPTSGSGGAQETFVGEDVNSLLILNLLSGTEYSVKVMASYPTGSSQPATTTASTSPSDKREGKERIPQLTLLYHTHPHHRADLRPAPAQEIPPHAGATERENTEGEVCLKDSIGGDGGGGAGGNGVSNPNNDLDNPKSKLRWEPYMTQATAEWKSGDVDGFMDGGFSTQVEVLSRRGTTTTMARGIILLEYLIAVGIHEVHEGLQVLMTSLGGPVDPPMP
ncbi:hypothetical protein NFI96_005118 [Prochilodus magdalenae]|nr:hypothetical protein NFI96_005118 [Prochilodus magdalenae]